MDPISLNEPQYVVDANGERTSVILSIRVYEEMLSRLEDLQDANDLDQAVAEAQSFRKLKDIGEDLRKAGRL